MTIAFAAHVCRGKVLCAYAELAPTPYEPSRRTALGAISSKKRRVTVVTSLSFFDPDGITTKKMINFDLTIFVPAL
jgi:hypothetical protein